MTVDQIVIKNLIAVIESDLSSIESIFHQIQSLYKKIKNTNPSLRDKAAMGYFLHNLYCAFENIFINIAKCFENQIDDKRGWHAQLLRKMKMEIKDIRPALISNKCYYSLDELRRFRHIFRYSYDFELDWERMKLVLIRSNELQKIYREELNQFHEYLNKLIEN